MLSHLKDSINLRYDLKKGESKMKILKNNLSKFKINNHKKNYLIKVIL